MASAKLPATQALHEVWPTVGDTVPFRHRGHSGVPLLSLERPMGQSEHFDEPLIENCPGMHMSHSVDLSTSINRPAEHAAHADNPVTFAYRPTTQSEQTSSEVAPIIKLEVPATH
jgi:hypothetical protein